jgi:anaerobic ribonucleoside-triphosphate reductase
MRIPLRNREASFSTSERFKQMSQANGKIRIKAIRTEVYSRIVGYYRPVQNWNRGKREEFSQRKYVTLEKSEQKVTN